MANCTCEVCGKACFESEPYCVFCRHDQDIIDEVIGREMLQEAADILGERARAAGVKESEIIVELLVSDKGFQVKIAGALTMICLSERERREQGFPKTLNGKA